MLRDFAGGDYQGDAVCVLNGAGLVREKKTIYEGRVNIRSGKIRHEDGYAGVML